MADTLTQEQIDAMLSSVLSGGDTASLDTHEEKEEIKEYDFRTPKKFTKEQIKILERIFENYSRHLSSYITGLLRPVSYTHLDVYKRQIYGIHSVHGIIMLGRIDIVTFDNPNGLEQVGSSYWRETLSSGQPQVNIAGENGSASVVSGALEMSNVDLSQEFSDMIITQRGFQANSRIITTSDTMLEEIVNLKR